MLQMMLGLARFLNMIKILGFALIITAFSFAYFSHNFVFSFLLLLIGFFLLFIQQVGTTTFKFTKMISKHPNEAYDWFKQDSYCWKIYEGELPTDYKDQIPSKQMKPLRLIVPKIGNRIVYIFGRFPECRESEKRFMKDLKSKQLSYSQK
jgi:hypothetical protein